MAKANNLERIRMLRPIDDIMFQLLAESEKVCQEILRVILEDNNLTVQKVIPQASIANIIGRSVRLDALCTLGNGTICNIEVQKENADDDLKRVRYNASSIVSQYSNKGTKFSEIPNIAIVYISQYDVFKKGMTIYHIDSVIRETNDIVDDGLRRIYVNTQYCDNDMTDIGALMRCFLQTDITDNKFPKLASRLSYFKNNQKGVDSMCKIIEEYGNERAAAILVKSVESIAKKVNGIDEACKMMDISRKDYDDAKALLEKTPAV